MAGGIAVPDDLASWRAHPEPLERPMLPGFALDRWRICNCSAFRRLQYKTQVFVTDEGDHYRTRLTHTLEVAQISRILAERLGLNPVLTEVIAIVHDLGHPPFGHAGEAALQELMADHQGFDHNLQALRVIDLLEHPYRHCHGLNLANLVRWAHQLHGTGYQGSAEAAPPTGGNFAPDAAVTAGGNAAALPADWRQQPLEGQVTNLADRIAYDVHDVEDALGAGLIAERDLHDLRLWRLASEPTRRQWPDLPLPAIRRPILDTLTLHLVEDLVATTQRNLSAGAGQTWEAFCRAGAPVVTFSEQVEAMLAEHERFLVERAYLHPKVAAMDYKARLIIRALFDAHVQQPRLLPPRYLRRIEQQGLHRVVCDYIAGMTDRFCQDAWHGLFQPFQRL